MDFVKNSSALLKGNFEKEFAKIKRPSGTTVVQYLQSLDANKDEDVKKMQKLLFNNGNLAATLALGLFLNRTQPEKTKLA